MSVRHSVRQIQANLHRAIFTFRRLGRPGLINIHCINPGNVGDMNCSPFDYYRSDRLIHRVDFRALADRSELPPARMPVVIGGGGLYYSPNTISKILQSRKGAVVAWGIGQNHSGKIGLPYPSWEKFTLFGRRDWDATVGEWVPCASCASGLFDQYKELEPIHPVVVYQHHDHEFDATGFPVAKNNVPSLEDALLFLASAEVVVTNSYHGVYWAQLLGRKVVAIPLTSRFLGFRFRPAYSSIHSWKTDLHLAAAAPEALDVCRDQTSRFARKVSETLEIPIIPKNH
jgi:hypothetical protein